MRCALAAVVLLAACSASAPRGSAGGAPDAASQSGPVTSDAGATAADAGKPDASATSPDAGPADPGSGDAGPADPGSGDAGALDAGGDAGLPDAGSASDRGIRLDCIPGGTLEPVWSMTGYLDPWYRFGTNFSVDGDDGAGDFVIRRTNWSHWTAETAFTQTPAGRTRASIASWSESPWGDVRGTSGYARRGLVVDMSDDWPTSQNGVAEIRAPDGSLLVSWNAGSACAGLPAGCTLQYFGGSATNGDLTVFAAYGYTPGSPGFAALVALDTNGQVLWQRTTVGASYSAIAVDESGIAFIQQEGGNVEAVDRGGVTLYELVPSKILETSYGRIYRGDRVVLDAHDGTPALTLPFDPSGSAVVTRSRIVVADGSGVVHSLDLATGQPIWSRTARIFAGDAKDVVALVGVDQRIHVVAPDGTDRASCSISPDAADGLALIGNHLVVVAGLRLGAFGLP